MHCPEASACASDPTSCQSHLNAKSIALLIFLTTLPLFSLLWLPLAGAASQLRWGEPSRKVSDAMGVTNGMLVVLVALALGFTPTFYLLLLSPHPCAGAWAEGLSRHSRRKSSYHHSYLDFVFEDAWLNVIMPQEVLPEHHIY